MELFSLCALIGDLFLLLCKQIHTVNVVNVKLETLNQQYARAISNYLCQIQHME